MSEGRDVTLMRGVPAQFPSAWAVRLRPSVFARAERTNLETLLRLDVDRLLAPFRREAGLRANAEPYGGWESDGLDGTAAGQVLSAVSAAIAGTADPRAADMLDRLISGLHVAQTAIGSGYVGGVPHGVALWEELVSGDVRGTPFELNERWVPLYNLHKTLAGLLDVVNNVEDSMARTVLDRFADWWLATAYTIGDDTLETILSTEFGGLNDTFARIAARRRDPRFLQLAMRFANRALLTPLLEGKDALDGLHANTRIPVVVGYATIARVAREIGHRTARTEGFGRAARTFFDAVAHDRSTAIGGNSVREHFPPRDDFSSFILAREGPESCNTINMIQLAAELYRVSRDDVLLEYMETAHVNHVLSMQHSDHGGIVYFTSHRPSHYRVYSPEQDGFWCCMLSGLQAHASHGSRAYALSDGEVQVLQFLPSVLTLTQFGLSLRQESGYPTTDRVRFDIRTQRDAPLAIRIPSWARCGSMVIDGESAEPVDAGSWWRHTIRPGRTRLELSFTREIRIERAPDASPWGWIRRGPTVLAQRIQDNSLSYRAAGTRTGHIASGRLLPLADTPVLDAVPRIEVLDDSRLTLHSARGELIGLEPFAGIHDARYRLSWPIAGSDLGIRELELHEIDRGATALEARVIDSVAFGEQQPESDHKLQAYDSEIGLTNGHHWRRVRSSLAMTMTNWGSHATTVRVEWLAESDPVGFDVSINRTELSAKDSAEANQRSLQYREFDIPEHLSSDSDLDVALSARLGGVMPRLVRIILLTETADQG